MGDLLRGFKVGWPRQLGLSHYDSPQADGANQRPSVLTTEMAKGGLVPRTGLASPPWPVTRGGGRSGDALVTVSSAAFGDCLCRGSGELPSCTANRESPASYLYPAITLSSLPSTPRPGSVFPELLSLLGKSRPGTSCKGRIRHRCSHLPHTKKARNKVKFVHLER